MAEHVLEDYLQMRPLDRIFSHRNTTVKLLSTLEGQHAFAAALRHPLATAFPPVSEYRFQFFQKAYTLAEKQCGEFDDMFCELAVSNMGIGRFGAFEEFGYRTFLFSLPCFSVCTVVLFNKSNFGPRSQRHSSSPYRNKLTLRLRQGFGGKLGLAAWDGGLLLSNLLFAHPYCLPLEMCISSFEAVLLGGRTRVIELGSGIGFTSAVAAHLMGRLFDPTDSQRPSLIATDYDDAVVSNLAFNLTLSLCDTISFLPLLSLSLSHSLSLAHSLHLHQHSTHFHPRLPSYYVHKNCPATFFSPSF